MNNDKCISVIIPVYNAAPFVRDAVGSALAQPETAEIILVATLFAKNTFHFDELQKLEQ